VSASLYECELGHVRATPVRHQFSYRTYMWLVDLDEMPALPRWLRPLARFDARDHLGAPGRSIRSNVDEFLAGHGIDLAGGRVRMLAHARVFGYVFNPLTLYWCSYRDGTPAGVIAEVHNTYGGRHCYLLHPDERGRASIDKALYVSPFNPVDGEYRMHLPEPDERLGITISLHRPDGGPPFVASLRGAGTTYRPATLLRAAVRHPLSTALVSARIRRHGVHLYLRGLKVQPRAHQEAVR
jgi:uncharacterized protein